MDEIWFEAEGTFVTLEEAARRLKVDEQHLWWLIHNDVLLTTTYQDNEYVSEESIKHLLDPGDLGAEDDLAWYPVGEWVDVLGDEEYPLDFLREAIPTGQLPTGAIFEHGRNGRTIRFTGADFEFIGVFAGRESQSRNP